MCHVLNSKWFFVKLKINFLFVQNEYVLRVLWRIFLILLVIFDMFICDFKNFFFVDNLKSLWKNLLKVFTELVFLRCWFFLNFWLESKRAIDSKNAGQFFCTAQWIIFLVRIEVREHGVRKIEIISTFLLGVKRLRKKIRSI